MNTDFTVISVFHMIIPNYIKWQLEERSKEENHGQENGFNTSLIINLAALNENLMQIFLLMYTEQISRQNSIFKQRFENEIRGGTWGKYNSLLDFLSNKSWKEVQKEVVKGQDYLFMLRSQIIHGNNITTKYSSEGKSIDQKKYRNIYDFLLEKGAINTSDSDGRDLLKNEVFDFFLKNSQLFFSELSNLLSESNKRLFRARIKYLLLLNGFSET